MKQILAILFLISSFLYAETLVLSPTDDMYTDSDHPGTQPDVTQLWTADFQASGHFERIMMKFDLSQLDGFDVTSATLKLTRLYSCPSGGTTASKFYPITQTWDETTWDQTQHIQYDTQNYMNYVFSGPGGNVNHNFEVDILQLITLWQEGTVVNNGFVIQANSNQKFSKFYSKEHSNAAYRPTLEIEYNITANEENCYDYEVTELSNYPNPFNPETSISFRIAESGNVKLDIYNIVGRKVKTLVSGKVDKGDHIVKWNGKNDTGNSVSSGVYLCRLKTSNTCKVHRITLLK